MKNKQVRIGDLPAFINTLVQKGMHITRCVKNGNGGEGDYILVEYCDTAMLINISRRVLHKDERNHVYSKSNLLKVDELTIKNK